MPSSDALHMTLDKHLAQSPPNFNDLKVETNSMYGLLPTATKEMILESIQSSFQSSTVDLGMVNEDFQIELKSMVCENATVP